MPGKKRRFIKNIDDLILAEDKKLANQYLHRLSRIEGQLSSAKKIPEAEKMRLYNEMYSARQALTSMQEKIKMDMVVEIMDATKANKPKTALQYCRQLLELLNKKGV